MTTTTQTITDEQIEALRAKAEAAGDDLQIAVCAVAIEEADADGRIAAIPDGTREGLAELGIYRGHIDAAFCARRECARVIAAAQAQS